jgi:hypothetical protein
MRVNNAPRILLQGEAAATDSKHACGLNVVYVAQCPHCNECLVHTQQTMMHLCRSYRRPRAAALKQQPSARPGTQLSQLLKRFGIDAAPGCKCRSMAAKMDALGPAWCESEQGMAKILEAMRTEAGKRGLPFLDAVGKMLVRQAVRAARRESDRATKASKVEGQEPPAV